MSFPRLSVICTFYNEAKFLECALDSIVEFVDDIILIEGAYQEVIKLGRSPRSTDGSVEIAKKFMHDHPERNIIYKEENRQSDPQQRNAALEIAKDLGAQWVLIVDGDEVYLPEHLAVIRMFTAKETKRPMVDNGYCMSMTFINDFYTYTMQHFPRLFRACIDSTFTNDNFMCSSGIPWKDQKHFMLPIKYFHYAFCKGRERFEDKKKWWESRFTNQEFHYDWQFDNKTQKIMPDNHAIYKFTGKHPSQIVNKFHLE